jgi:hypothetical protein
LIGDLLVFDDFDALGDKQKSMSDLYLLLAHQHPKQRSNDIQIEASPQYCTGFLRSKANQVVEIVQIVRKIHMIVGYTFTCDLLILLFSCKFCVDVVDEVIDLAGECDEVGSEREAAEVLP